MPLDDDNPEKWKKREHTDVKHEILRKYLTAWTRILSGASGSMHYFDGFAGRGRYEDGDPGSPLLALEVASKHSDSFDRFYCTFNERNEDNFEQLKREVEGFKKECAENVDVEYRCGEFEKVAPIVMKDRIYNQIPSLVFVDPFGYKGTPFWVISDIMKLRKSGDEVFITFMVDKIRRFLSDPDKEYAITRALGTEDWKGIEDIQDRKKQEEELLSLYEQQLKEQAGVNHVFPFQMKDPDKDTTIYYLIHATNHFKGLEVMKQVMYNEGVEDTFAYLGPDHYIHDNKQTTLFESTGAEDTKERRLADFLYEEFEGECVEIGQMIEQTYKRTDLIKKHYTGAMDILTREDRARIHNRPNRGGSKNGKDDNDLIEFVATNARLSDF